MQRNVWSVEELAQLLAGAKSTIALAPRTPITNDVEAALLDGYRQGYEAALVSIGISTGVIRPARQLN